MCSQESRLVARHIENVHKRFYRTFISIFLAGYYSMYLVVIILVLLLLQLNRLCFLAAGAAGN